MDNDRIEAFVKEYGELVKKHKVDFASFPMYEPDGQGGFRLIVRTVPVETQGNDFIPKA